MKILREGEAWLNLDMEEAVEEIIWCFWKWEIENGA